jgi:glycosyltransferase involved in cell wall biosynthesis
MTNTIQELQVRGFPVTTIYPSAFFQIPYVFYGEIKIPVLVKRKLTTMINNFLAFPGPHAFHISTESLLGLTAANILTRMKLPFTTAFHTDFASYAYSHFGIPKSWVWKYLRWFHNRANRVMVATDSTRIMLDQQNIRNLVSWGRGVDQKLFYFDDLIPETPPIYLYVGRLSIEKNIKAFLDLHLPNSVVVGDGPDRKHLERHYPEVKFLGKLTQEELADWMRRAACFVFPSQSETFGLVMAEAMACGCPVAALPVQGPLDVVDLGVTGWLDQNLELAISNASKLNRGKVAKRAQERFSWSVSTEQFIAHLLPTDPWVGTTLERQLGEI